MVFAFTLTATRFVAVSSASPGVETVTVSTSLPFGSFAPARRRTVAVPSSPVVTVTPRTTAPRGPVTVTRAPSIEESAPVGDANGHGDGALRLDGRCA